MKKLLLIFGLVVLAFSAAILLYDTHFIHRYGVDMNEVAAVVDGGIADWPTGERPFFAEFPAWHYGVASTIIAVALITISALIPRRRKSGS